MDPPQTILYEEDTSYALMLAADRRGHRVDHCLLEDLLLWHGKAFAEVSEAHVQSDPEVPVRLGSRERVCLQEVDAILLRSDPPFDDRYLWGTLILERVRGATFVMNDPRGLRDANEKLYACHFPELMPRSLVARDRAHILAFIDEVGGRAVVKPLHGAGGDGVMALARGDLNLNAIVETATRQGRRQVMVQEFLPEVKQGDKRILVLDGEPLGAILRVSRPGDLRSNIHVGGSVLKANLEPEDHQIVQAMAPRLREDGLWFVGLDVIGGKLTEVNVTSPTGIQQMSRLNAQDLPGRVVQWIEERVRP